MERCGKYIVDLDITHFGYDMTNRFLESLPMLPNVIHLGFVSWNNRCLSFVTKHLAGQLKSLIAIFHQHISLLEFFSNAKQLEYLKIIGNLKEDMSRLPKTLKYLHVSELKMISKIEFNTQVETLKFDWTSSSNDTDSNILLGLGGKV